MPPPSINLYPLKGLGGARGCSAFARSLSYWWVIGIIALLISILLPALNAAREQANTIKCLSNMRQIGLAQQMYAASNKGFCVPAGYIIYPVSGAGLNEENYATILVNDGYLPEPTVNNIFDAPSATSRSSFARQGSLTLSA